MTKKYEIEDDGMELPEGWDPEADLDARLRLIARVAREADRPQMPPPAVFSAVQMTVRRQLLQEGLLNTTTPSPAPEPAEQSFGAWLRSIFLGGGFGGQTVRLGLVGAFAFFAGTAWFSNPQPARRDTVANSFVPNNSNTGAPSNSAPEGKGESAPTIVAESLTNSIPINRLTHPTLPSGGVSVTRSAVAEAQSLPSWQQTVGNTANPWLMQSNNGVQQVPVAGAAPAGVYSDARADLASQALDQLQVLKFYSLVERNERSLAEIRRVEQTLGELLAQAQWEASPSTEALKAYRLGEQALAAGRHHDAQTAFDRVTQLVPGTAAAFLADFQVGRISFDRTQDYELALESFRRCLEDYPSTFLTPDHRNYLMDRVEVLTTTQPEQWQGVRLFQQAEKTRDPQQAVPLLMRVIETCPSQKLVAQAAMRLRELALADPQATLPVDAIVPALQARVERSQPGFETARLQFAMAEILASETDNYQQALAAYRRVLELKPDDNIQRVARIRINHLSAQRFQGVVTDP